MTCHLDYGVPRVTLTYSSFFLPLLNYLLLYNESLPPPILSNLKQQIYYFTQLWKVRKQSGSAVWSGSGSLKKSQAVRRGYGHLRLDWGWTGFTPLATGSSSQTAGEGTGFLSCGLSTGLPECPPSRGTSAAPRPQHP